MRNLRQSSSAVRSVALRGTFGMVVLLCHLQEASAKGPDSALPGPSDSRVPEASNPAEKRASKLAADATGPDFHNKRFAAGEKKLREAIQICMLQTCNTELKARLHRDLGYVYVAGMKHVEDGKDEFTAALTIDAAVALSPDMEEQSSVKQAFEDVKTEMNSSSTVPEPKDSGASPPKKDAPADEQPKTEPPTETANNGQRAKDDDADVAAESFPEPAAAGNWPRLNWFSVAIEQDLVLHSNTKNACSTGSHYHCFDRQDRAYTIINFAPGGNQVEGGTALGTWRVLLGYDRAFANRFTVGARAGSIIAGKAEMVVGERKFLYFHAEARAAAWLGRNPFSEAGIHPYLFLSGGAAEADGKVVVQVSFDRCPNCKLNAWKRSGVGFAGGGAGVKWAIAPNHGPILEARYLQFFNPLLPSIGVQAGYAVGF